MSCKLQENFRRQSFLIVALQREDLFLLPHDHFNRPISYRYSIVKKLVTSLSIPQMGADLNWFPVTENSCEGNPCFSGLAVSVSVLRLLLLCRTAASVRAIHVDSRALCPMALHRLALASCAKLGSEI